MGQPIFGRARVSPCFKTKRAQAWKTAAASVHGSRLAACVACSVSTQHTTVMSHPPASPSVHAIHAYTHPYSRMAHARLCLSEPQPCLESMVVSTKAPSSHLAASYREVLSQAIAAYPRPAHGALVTSSAVPVGKVTHCCTPPLRLKLCVYMCRRVAVFCCCCCSCYY